MSLMRAISCLSGVLLVLAALTILHSREQEDYELSGQVRDICGAWLPGTRVTLTNEEGVTFETHVNEPAGYRFSRVPGPGPWRLTADLLGFERLTVDQVSLRPGVNNGLHLRLLVEATRVRFGETINPHSSTRLVPYEVIGTVTAGGVPVDGSIVTLRHEKKGRVEHCEGDERGRYTFFVYDRGPWRLTVKAPGFPTYTRNLLLQPRQRITIDVPLKPSPQKRASLSLTAAQVPTVSQAASKFVPGVTWRPKSVLTADFSCRGRKEQAILGVNAKEIVIAVFLNGLAEPPEVLRYSAEMRDAKQVQLTLESLDYDSEEAIGELPGFRRSRTCQGLNLSDGKIDSAHIYWNHDAKRFDDWVR